MKLIEEIQKNLLPVDSPFGCIVWTGEHTPNGYAMLRVAGDKPMLVHRLIYAIFVDNEITGLDVHHRCLCKGCVNIKHLIALDPREHTRQHGLWHPRLVQVRAKNEREQEEFLLLIGAKRA